MSQKEERGKTSDLKGELSKAAGVEGKTSDILERTGDKCPHLPVSLRFPLASFSFSTNFVPDFLDGENQAELVGEPAHGKVF